ncbi:hypothetical protein F5Y16DRAFT_390425 [Xylariaceae sp. FL0255]|nr:hypothetical protein F5Y16DRAFT_390425 [Xylariaceae sp. FL0255]
MTPGSLFRTPFILQQLRKSQPTCDLKESVPEVQALYSSIHLSTFTMGKNAMTQSDAQRIQSSQVKSGGDMSSGGFAARAQSAGDRNANAAQGTTTQAQTTSGHGNTEARSSSCQK